MDRYSILDQDAPAASQATGVFPARESMALPAAAKPHSVSAAKDPRATLSEIARRDLDATLQLLAERAQYITGASGVTIALRGAQELMCRARAGSAAPELGAPLSLSFRLIAESLRTRQTQRCDDVEHDSRINPEHSCDLGVKSVMIVPIQGDREMAGVFELLAGRQCAFKDRDVAPLERLAALVETALEHAAAAERALIEIAAAQADEPAPHESKSEVASAPAVCEEQQPVRENPPAVKTDAAESAASKNLATIQLCQACGFPVSTGRTLCLDCEEARGSEEGLNFRGGNDPALLAQLLGSREESWFQSHMYTIGTLLVAALTVVLLMLKMR